MTDFRPISPEQAEIFALHPLPVLVLDREQRVRFVNDAGLRMAEHPADDPIGHVVWDRYPALRESGFFREYSRVTREGITAVFEEYRPEAQRWFSVTAYPADGGLVAMLRDITAEKHSHEDRKRTEQTMRLAQETARIGSFTRDLRERRSEWSEQLYRLLGLQPNSVSADVSDHEPERNFIHPDDRAAVRDVWKRAILSGRTQSVRHRVIRADGELRVFDANIMAVFDQNDEADRVVGTVRDITDELKADAERAQLETQMQQAQKLESLGVLAGGIAHDFNNLLVGILGNASLALLDLPSDSPVRHSVTEIEQAAQRAAELTRQLLAYAGKGRFVVEPVDCSQVVREMTALLRTAVSKNAQVSLSLADSLPPVEADVTQLRQVVMNLITNASDALPENGGLIHIHTGKVTVDADYLASCVPGSDTVPGEFVFMEVRDEGRGIDELTRMRIFDPFFTTKFTGRGLGLAATLGIVRGHKGAIRVYSEPGKGTSIKLLFPAGVGVVTAPAAPAATSWQASGEVLVVDDEPSVRAVSRALLRRRGFSVAEASGGREAVEMVRADPDRFRLVLLDLTMPDMGGDETFRELRVIAPLLKVVLMSGYNEQEVTRQFVGRGLAAFLQKPFRAEELDNAARKVLGEA